METYAIGTYAMQQQGSFQDIISAHTLMGKFFKSKNAKTARGTYAIIADA